MSTPLYDSVDDLRRKRLRKGTTSCWECKRRKVRCEPSTVNGATCAGCVSRGTPCRGQEQPPEDNSSTNGVPVGERLGRIESLLGTLLDKLSLKDDLSTPGPEATPQSSGDENTVDLVENAPILSLFDDFALGRREVSKDSAAQSKPASTPGSSLSADTCPPRLDGLRKVLAAFLISQHDADLVTAATNAWTLVQIFPESSTDDDIVLSFDIQRISQSHPITIIRILISICMCFQQLPPDFDIGQLHLGQDVRVLTAKYLSAIDTHFLPNDDFTCTIEGLGCVMLLATFHLTCGMLKRSWLLIRKGVSIAQLLGFDKKLGRPVRLGEFGSDFPGSYLWEEIMLADRYLSVFIGVPCGASDDSLNLEAPSQDEGIDIDHYFTQRLCVIAGRIIERNRAQSLQSFATTQEIDIQMEKLTVDFPSSFWEVPPIIRIERTAIVSRYLERIMYHLWYFQLAILVHLPFFLRARTERCFEYSKARCIQSAKDLLIRYAALKRTGRIPFCSPVADFAGFLAALILTLDLIETKDPPVVALETSTVRERNEAEILVQQTIEYMEIVAKDPKEVAAAQSVKVIKTLLATRETEPTARNMRLTIPHLGTITIIVKPAAETLEPQSNNRPSSRIERGATRTAGNGSDDSNTTLTFGQDSSTNPAVFTPDAPFVSFASSQYPTATPELPAWYQPAPAPYPFSFGDDLNVDVSGDWIFQDFT